MVYFVLKKELLTFSKIKPPLVHKLMMFSQICLWEINAWQPLNSLSLIYRTKDSHPITVTVCWASFESCTASFHRAVIGTRWNEKSVLCEWLQLLKMCCILPREQCQRVKSYTWGNWCKVWLTFGYIWTIKKTLYLLPFRSKSVSYYLVFLSRLFSSLTYDLTVFLHQIHVILLRNSVI